MGRRKILNKNVVREQLSGLILGYGVERKKEELEEINELLENIYKTFEDLELYKKAFYIAIELYEGGRIDLRPFNKDERTTQEICLDQARKELANEIR